ncbi:Uncharacterized protein APZ42_000578, partial [Daphnia magna]
LAFGLTNAPGTFQLMMNFVLTSVLEHVLHLREIFGLLERANLKRKLSKCKFLQEKVNYLGHIISAEGVAPDPTKIEAITNYKRPCTVRELQSFLGLASYYRRFIEKFSTIAHPLLVQSKGQPKNEIKWGLEEEKAFEVLRKSLITEPVLSYPDFGKEFIIFMDASDHGLGAVLSQEIDG